MTKSKTAVSRRSFLSTTAMSAAATIAYSTLKTRGGDVLATSIEAQGNGSAAKFQPAFAKLDEYIGRHMRF